MEKFCVLYLDDSPAQLDAFRLSLEGSEYVLWTALSVSDALRVLRVSRPSLVVVDYQLGETTGDQCLPMLRQHASPEARFYLYTTSTEAFRRHREMGFDGVLMLKGKAPVRTQIDAIARSWRGPRAS